MQHQRQPGPDKGSAASGILPGPGCLPTRIPGSCPHGCPPRDGPFPTRIPGGGHEKSRWPGATGFAVSVRRVSYLLVLRKVLARAASGELGYFLMSSFMRALAAAFWFTLLKQMPCFR